jgi:hypothetical protein
MRPRRRNLSIHSAPGAFPADAPKHMMKTPADLQADAGFPLAKAGSIAFLRIFLGVMWLFEVTVGHNWKIGGFTSGANPLWLGAGAGDGVREAAGSAIDDGTYGAFAWLFEAVIVPNAELFGYVTIGLQLILGVSFIIGFAVRPMAVIAVGMDLAIFMLGNSRIPPFFTAMHLFVLFSGAGRYYGLDGWLLERAGQARGAAARVLRRVIELPVLRPEHTAAAIAVFAILALFFVMTIPTRATTRFQNVALDLGALSGLLALGLFAYRTCGDRLAAVSAMLRIFVGFKFLHEIWTRTQPGLNALPGFAGIEAQTATFQLVVDNHLAPFSWLAENVFVAYMGPWVVVLGALQLAVGLALVLGYRTRLFGMAGLLFLGTLIVFGMTRYPPFLFGLLVPVVALDGGRIFSFDNLRGAARAARYGLPIPAPAVPVLITLAGLNAVAASLFAFQTGIVPDAYVDSMPAMTTAFVAIFSGLLAFVGWLQLHPEFEHSGELPPFPARSEEREAVIP